MVIMWTISTSCTSGARRISASTRVSGSAHPGWMYTRIPERTQSSASSGACNLFLYSSSQEDILLPKRPRSLAATVRRHLHARIRPRRNKWRDQKIYGVIVLLLVHRRFLKLDSSRLLVT